MLRTVNVFTNIFTKIYVGLTGVRLYKVTFTRLIYYTNDTTDATTTETVEGPVMYWNIKYYLPLHNRMFSLKNQMM